MMSWITILILIIVGTVLFIVELLLIPGTLIIGLLGIISNLLGISLGYYYFNTEGALFATGMAVAINAFTIYKSLLRGSWKRLTLKEPMEEQKRDTTKIRELYVGNHGITVSTLRPVGKADFQGETYEVRVKSNLIEVGKPVVITEIKGKKIYVQESDDYNLSV